MTHFAGESMEEIVDRLERRIGALEDVLANFTASLALGSDQSTLQILAGQAHNELRNLDVPEEWAA